MNDSGDENYHYRETVRRGGEAEGKHISHIGGRGVYAHVDIGVWPLKPEFGVRVTWEAGGSIPPHFVPSVLEGIYDALGTGELTGEAVIGVQVTVKNGSYHDLDSTPEAFREAARRGTADALRQAEPVLLEAVAHFEAKVPAAFVDRFTELSSSFGGRVTKTLFGTQDVFAEIDVPSPLGFDFMARLLEAGEGQFSVAMCFAGFEIKPEPPDGIEPWVRVKP